MKSQKLPSNRQTNVTQVFQRSPVCFYWNVVREKLLSSEPKAFTGYRLRSNVPIDKQGFLGEKNGRSPRSKRHRKELASLGKTVVSKKLGEKKSASGAKVTKPRKSNKRKGNSGDTNGRLERWILGGVVLIVLGIAIIDHFLGKNDVMFNAILPVFTHIIDYYFGNKK